MSTKNTHLYDYSVNKEFVINSDGTIKVSKYDKKTGCPEGKAIVVIGHVADEHKVVGQEEINTAVNGTLTADQGNALWKLVADAATYLIESGTGKKAEAKLIEWDTCPAGEGVILIVPDGAITDKSANATSSAMAKWIMAQATPTKAPAKPAKPAPAADDDEPTKAPAKPAKKAPSVTYLEATEGLEVGSEAYKKALKEWAASQL